MANKKHALICGSMAYDTIMLFEDKFRNHILPDKVHMLNVSFLVPEMRREFGGCAGNIAYNLKLIGGDPLIMATVGDDFGPYADWLDKHKIDKAHVRALKGTYTGQAFITTDMEDNQLTAFHPGAMSYSDKNKVGMAEDVGIGIVSPDGRDGMIEHAAQFAKAGIPFIFDPGQGLPMFDGNDLECFIKQASYMVMNDYEAQMVENKTGREIGLIARDLEMLLVTKGAEGANLYHNDRITVIPAATIDTPVDPTGCGDALRAGLLYGYLNGMDWETSALIGSLLGAIKIESVGPQNHKFTKKSFRQRFEKNFGRKLEL
ncbi:MAG: carbohydrate kinase family protein [Proteobacteria bacterium]|jgi:adenosine kinase|nr:carbohydrate kinase family protein [Pseudomonadota bacterium]